MCYAREFIETESLLSDVKENMNEKILQALLENLILDLLNLHSSVSREQHVFSENEMMIKNIEKVPIEMHEEVLFLQKELPSKKEIYDKILLELESLIFPLYSPVERKMKYKENKYKIRGK